MPTASSNLPRVDKRLPSFKSAFGWSGSTLTSRWKHSSASLNCPSCAKASPWPRVADVRDHRSAWKEYVRGHVVSKYAEGIIKQFLSATCMYTSKDEDDPDCEDYPDAAPIVLPPGVLLGQTSLVNLLQKLRALPKKKDRKEGEKIDST